jgi:hypothetical protein
VLRCVARLTIRVIVVSSPDWDSRSGWKAHNDDYLVVCWVHDRVSLLESAN